jgi:hypothetical protein
LTYAGTWVRPPVFQGREGQVPGSITCGPSWREYAPMLINVGPPEII